MNNQRIRLGVVTAVALVAIGLLALRSDEDPPESTEGITASRDDEVEDPGSGEVDTSTESSPDAAEQSGAGDVKHLPADDGDPEIDAGEGDGTINEKADVIPGQVAKPVPFDETTGFGDGMNVRIADVEAVQTQARLPGERSGPGIAVTFEMTNGSESVASLDGVTVDVVTSDGASAIRILDPSREEFAGDLGPGESRSGTYVFTLPPEQRNDLRVHIKYSADTPVVVFQGNAPGA